MSNVVVKIKTPPVVTAPVHSVFMGTTIYVTPPSPDNTSPAKIPAAQVPNLPTQGPAVQLSYVRNNRVVGYFADATLARDAIAFHISRENEFGADI